MKLQLNATSDCVRRDAVIEFDCKSKEDHDGQR